MACTLPGDQQKVEYHRGVCWQEATECTVVTFADDTYLEEESHA